MGRLGFASFGVARRSKRGERMSVKLEATWKARKEPAEPQAEPQAEPPSKRKRLKAHEGAHGHVHVCAVCEEEKPMVVMAPCGHVICRDSWLLVLLDYVGFYEPKNGCISRWISNLATIMVFSFGLFFLSGLSSETEDCKENLTNADQCPFCRKLLICTTQGLFFS